MTSRVLCCGLATLDILQTVDRVPGPNEKVTARGLQVGSGGPATNAAVTATALGVPTTLVTALGSGPLADVIKADLDGWGVTVIDLGAADFSPPVSTVLVTQATGERAVVSVNGSLAVDYAPAEPALLDDVRVVLVDGHHLELAITVAEIARARGIPVLLDGGSWKPGLEKLLKFVDIAVLSADFTISKPTHDLLRAVHNLGPVVVAQSHGEHPIQILLADQVVSVPVSGVDIVDTLGAGDVLHGALAAYLSQVTDALSAEILLAGVRFAARAASASCESSGARGWLTTSALALLRQDLT